VRCLPTSAGIDFKQGFADEILKLRSFVEQHGVTDGAAPGHSLSDSDMRALGQLVARSCQLCQVRGAGGEEPRGLCLGTVLQPKAGQYGAWLVEG
jgi:hypothetical protein